MKNAGKYNSVDSDIYNLASDMRDQLNKIIDSHL